MVSKKAASSSKSSKTTSSSSSSKVATTSTSSSSKSTAVEKSGSQSSAQSNVIISEVVGSSNVIVSPTQYVVTQPEIVQQSKERYIFGGTQIVEVGSTLGSDLIHHEKNHSSWDGKFTYEGTPERTVRKVTTTAIITEPTSLSTVTEQFETTTQSSTGASTSANTHESTSTKNVKSTSAHKTASPELKKQSAHTTAEQVKSDANKDSSRNKGNWDGSFTYERSDSDKTSSKRLIDEEVCVAKKAYITTDKSTEEEKKSATKSTDKNTSRTTDDNIRSTNTYPASNLNTIRDSKVSFSDSTALVDTKNSDQFEQFSHSYSTSSKNEKTSSSSKVIEIVDGKERIASETFNESGSLQSKSSEEKFKSKSGTGITPKLEYDQKLTEENITYKNDKPGKEPVYDRNFLDSERNVRITGNETPIEYTKGRIETTRFDDKTKKYITDVHSRENNKQIVHDLKISDSINSNYGTQTSRLNIESQTSNIGSNQLVDKTSSESQSFNKNVDYASTSNTSHLRNTDINKKNKTDKNITDTTTTYTSKAFDDKTNSWQVVNESTVNEKNISSTEKRSQPIVKSSLKTDKKTTGSILKTNELKTVSQQLYDEKTKSWREVDEKTVKLKRPSLIRYVSKDNDGKYTTIYKKKVFDKRSGTWKVVDEKIYRNNHFNEHIPEVIEDVTNVTTTTYTTKVFDNKTNTWKIVDEKSFTDHQTVVPQDIADEIAKDQPDIANITTTTELTKVR